VRYSEMGHSRRLWVKLDILDVFECAPVTSAGTPKADVHLRRNISRSGPNADISEAALIALKANNRLLSTAKQSQPRC
jgi:hypothetical protein